MKITRQTLGQLAKAEVQVLKKTNQEFKLKKEIFDPCHHIDCFYGQVFGSSINIGAKKFKESNNIPVGFGPDFIFSNKSTMTPLESFLSTLWIEDKKEQVYKIVEQFATWEGQPNSTQDDLFI